MTYNGHLNWNHWNVSLWINNDEPLYRLAQDCIRRFPGRDEAARQLLGRLQHGTTPARTPDGAPYSLSSVRAAMRGIKAPTATGRLNSEPELQNLPGTPAHALEMHWARHGGPKK